MKTTLKTEEHIENQIFNLQDILYHVMLNSDIKEINSLCRTNEMANQLCYSNFFWKNKFSMDYPFINPKGFKDEYIAAYNANKMAKNFIQVLKLMLDKTKSLTMYLANVDGMTLDIKKLR